MRSNVTRRQFMKTTAALAGSALISSYPDATWGQTRLSAVDRVTLGKTGLQLSRLGIGTGSDNGRVLRDLGMDTAAQLIRYAYDQGITYIDTAENYRTHDIVREAIKGLPREKLFILTKMPRRPERPLEVIDRYRRELGVEYIDCLLLHCMLRPNWDETHKPLMDAFAEAKDKQIIRAHGVSCHAHEALSLAARLDWVDVNLVRFNPQAVCCDTAEGRWLAPSTQADLAHTLEQLKIMRQNNHGIIGMKMIGNGAFTRPEDREKSIRFAMEPGRCDAVTIGFKSPAEIDEAILRMNRALNSVPSQPGVLL